MQEKFVFSRIGLGLTIALIALTFAQLFPSVVLGLFATIDLRGDLFIAILYLCSCLAYCGVFWLFVRPIPIAPPNPQRFDTKQTFALIGIVYCIGMGLLYFLSDIGNLIHEILHFIFTRTDQSMLTDVTESNSLWVSIFMTCVCAPVFEEFLFRKLLLDRLRAFGEKIAILCSGIAFGLFHQNFMQFFFAAMLGCLFAYVYLKTNRLWSVILLHFMVNAFSTILLPILTHVDETNGYVMFYGLIVMFWILGGCFLVLFRKKVTFGAPCYTFSVPITGKLVVLNGGMLTYLILCLVCCIAFTIL